MQSTRPEFVHQTPEQFIALLQGPTKDAFIKIDQAGKGEGGFVKHLEVAQNLGQTNPTVALFNLLITASMAIKGLHKKLGDTASPADLATGNKILEWVEGFRKASAQGALEA
jgi:hypothetical protein